jgi:hypothetical protein
LITIYLAIAGTYIGSVLQEVQFRDFDKKLKHSPARRFLKGWIGLSFATSLSFFSKRLLITVCSFE